MVWFVPSGGNANSPTVTFGPTIDTTKPIDSVSASATFSVSNVLGRSIPIVIGTGKVEGIPVIGGAKVTQTITGYDTNQILPPDYNNTSLFNFGQTPTYAPIYSSVQATQLGYLLAYDPFGDGYDLVRVEINDTVVYDAENGIGASETFRFYGGTQTAVDPITTAALGAKAGAWQGFAMIFIDGFVSDSAPTVKCVISNASSGTPGNQEIAWIGSTPVINFINTVGRGSSYEIADGLIYQLLTKYEVPGIDAVYLSVLDISTHQERYRIPLEDTASYINNYQDIWALRGSGHVVVRLRTTNSDPGKHCVYNVSTGAKVAEGFGVDGNNWTRWLRTAQFGTKYVLIGQIDDPLGSHPVGTAYGEVDLVAKTFTWMDGGGFEINTIVPGPSSADSITFFATNDQVLSSENVFKFTFNGDVWTEEFFYTGPQIIEALHYDPLTQYLITAEWSPANVFRYIDTGDATEVSNFSAPYSFRSGGGFDDNGVERLWARPGFALFHRLNSAEYYLLDIRASTTSLFATVPTDPSVATNATGGIFDQNRLAYYYAFGDDHWTEYRLPGISPGLVDLDSFILTKVMFLAGYGPSELTFEGFSGITGYGFVIASDTNVRTAVQAIADIYSFSFADIGSGFYFKKPGRDDAFAYDATLTTADLVFGDKSAIDSTDEAAIRTTSRVELTYFSKTDYNSRPASFQMPAVNNSIKVDKYSTPMVMSDLDAKTFCTQKYFEAQMRLRDHTYSLMGRPTLLPGDVVSVPSGDIAFGVQIASVALNRDMSVDIQASDFQTSVATNISPVTNVGIGSVSVTLQTQYIHLDVPLFRYGDDLGGLGLRQYGVVASRGQAGWGGGLLLRGDTASDLTAILSQAPQYGVVGICTTVLGNPLDPFGTTDTSTVTFRKTAGDKTLLINQTEAQVLAGANFAFIGSQGRWEGVGYKTAVDNGDGTFTLSGFTIRGYRGTEVFAPLHQVGDQFLMIDASWLKGVSHPLTDLGLTKFYKAIGLTQNPATGTVVPHTLIGAAETPYAGVNLTATVNMSGGLDLSGDYRSRLATGLNPANHGEAAQSFEWDVYSGATYKRTLTSVTNSVHYASADVVADQGSDPPAALSFRWFKMSALPILVPGQARPVAGRGYEARAYVVLDPGPLTADNIIITADSTAFTADAV